MDHDKLTYGRSIDGPAAALRLKRLAYRKSKRCMDLLVATVLFIVLLPLMILAALIIKLHDGGSVLYRQVRIGENGTGFQIYKFRTMRPAVDGGGPATQITRLGAILRRYSLDELPQLLNVLEGTMSLVGPRPHIPAEDELYDVKIPGYPYRKLMRPGMTGLAQVKGYNGPITSRHQIEGRTYYDLQYLLHQSIREDMRILMRTLPVVCKGRECSNGATKLSYSNRLRRHPLLGANRNLTVDP